MTFPTLDKLELPKLPNNLRWYLNYLEQLLNSNDDPRSAHHAVELRRLIEEGRYLIMVGARRSDPMFREIDAEALQEARELAERREYNTNGD